MAQNLVIVESPAKAKTLEKFLGPDFFVKASTGHIRDLPVGALGVDLEKNFSPTYIILKGKEKIVKELKGYAAKAKRIFLAPDPDREGEAIAWHLAYILQENEKVRRIEFNEITKSAVLRAVENPRDIDMKRVEAQQARRILDRIVGYKISPLLWKKVRKGLSAGRVQSVAVRLICEREMLVQRFVPKEYWKITANLTKQDRKIIFTAQLLSKEGQNIEIKNKTEAEEILENLKDADFVVKEVKTREQKRNSPPPFITSTLQQDAARKLGFQAKKTMSIAQKLYEGVEISGEGYIGLITYMRTDSVRVSDEAIKEVRKYINEKISPQYLPKVPHVYKSKKGAQDAHEAIRPTSVFRTPELVKKDLTPDQYKLYELIWKRFVASQMKSAVLDITTADINAKNYVFRANGNFMKFDGFLKLYEESKDEGEERPNILPDLEAGEKLFVIKIEPSQHFTQPPARYNEASLVKELEEKGIGRPSTYAPIISTIIERGYVVKEGKALKPTELGIITNGLLVKHFPKILDVKFTALMEEELDEIEEGKISWTKVLQDFYTPFKEAMEKASVEMQKVKLEEKTDEICEKCGSPMVVRQSKYGPFLACSNFPKCRNTKDLPRKGEEKIEDIPPCEKCGSPMEVKRSRYGLFLACTNYPKCKNTRSILKKIGVKCPMPDCDGEIVEKRTKKGRIFYSCSNYPKCQFSSWQKPLVETCPVCGAYLVEKYSKSGITKECSKKCGYKE